MCTLVTVWKAHAATDLLIGLNRDEFLARKTEPMHRWSAGGVPLVAGRDGMGGGTWFAIGPTVVAGLTNDRGQGSPAPRARSRGDLVVHAATASTLDVARERLRQLDVAEYGPFFLACFDADEAACFSNRGGVLGETPLGPGAHVLGNFGLDAPADPVVAHLLPKMESLVDAPFETARMELRGLLSEHGPGAPCVHHGPYGTRSSLVYARGARAFLDVVEAPPCEAEYVDRTADLLARAPNV